MIRLKDLQAVRKILKGLPQASQRLFFRTPKGSLLGLTPLEALNVGQIAQVRAAATAFAQA